MEFILEPDIVEFVSPSIAELAAPNLLLQESNLAIDMIQKSLRCDVNQDFFQTVQQVLVSIVLLILLTLPEKLHVQSVGKTLALWNAIQKVIHVG